MVLRFNISNQILTKHKSQEKLNIIADSSNYLVARFDLSTKEWKGKIVYALFTFKKKTYKVILGSNPDLAENECYVPQEVIHAPQFTVSCYCDDRITTTAVTVDVAPSGYTEDIANQVATPSVMEQMDSLMRRYAFLCNSMLKDCAQIQADVKRMKEEATNK